MHPGNFWKIFWSWKIDFICTNVRSFSKWSITIMVCEPLKVTGFPFSCVYNPRRGLVENAFACGGELGWTMTVWDQAPWGTSGNWGFRILPWIWVGEIMSFLKKPGNWFLFHCSASHVFSFWGQDRAQVSASASLPSSHIAAPHSSGPLWSLLFHW